MRALPMLVHDERQSGKGETFTMPDGEQCCGGRQRDFYSSLCEVVVVALDHAGECRSGRLSQPHAHGLSFLSSDGIGSSLLLWRASYI